MVHTFILNMDKKNMKKAVNDLILIVVTAENLKRVMDNHQK